MQENIYYVLDIPANKITDKQLEILNNIFNDRNNLKKARMFNSNSLKPKNNQEVEFLCLIDGKYKFDIWCSNIFVTIKTIKSKQEEVNKIIYLDFNNFKKKMLEKESNEEKYEQERS